MSVYSVCQEETENISQSQCERASSAQLCVSWDVVCKGDIVQLWLSKDQHSLRLFHKMCFMTTCALKMCLILVLQNIPAQRVQLPYLTFLSFNEGSKNIYSIITWNDDISKAKNTYNSM